jgi:hypothetical protein
VTTRSFRPRCISALLSHRFLVVLAIFGVSSLGFNAPVHATAGTVVFRNGDYRTGAGGSSADESAARGSDKNDKAYAVIFGTVWDPDNRPVYGVTVKIRRAKDKHAKWEVYSDHHGEFAQRVPAGEMDYILTADLKGVKTADGQPLHLDKEVTVHVYDEEREDTGLHLTLN